MLHFKRHQSKAEKLRDMRRAYIEQLAFIRQFRKDEDGGLIVLTLLLLISMLVVGGMAVDFMRFESERTQLQSVSDRAVLAAANLNNEGDGEQIITDFFTAEGYADAIVGTPNVDKDRYGSTITLESAVDVNTFYLRLIGIDTLTAPATASAIEGTGNVEISLVLDISGSMGRDMEGDAYVLDADGNKTFDDDGNIVTEWRTETRLFFLQQAANQFIEDLLQPEYEDRVSINLIAYSQHVRLGDDLYTALRTTPDSINVNNKVGSSYGITNTYAEPFEYTWVNDAGEEVEEGTEGATLVTPDFSPVTASWDDGEDVYTNPSRCVTFHDDEYDVLEFDTERVYQQVEYVDFYGSGSSFWWAPCSVDPDHGIIVMSQDVDELQDAINNYTPTVNTSIHRGMKWGVSLLDPTMRDLIDGIPTVDDAFRGIRPVEYGDGTTQKYVVIMTDGQTVSSSRIKREAIVDDPNYTGEDYYDTYDERLGFSESSGKRYIDDDGLNSTRWPDDDDPAGLNYVIESIGSTTELNEKLDSLCQLVRDEYNDHGSYKVFTISMGLVNDTMTDCATEGADAFVSSITSDEDGVGLNEIFGAIADQITALRLSQ
ncbi:Flp pilus assembly protein TadG [Yoonia maricola]|uniref:Flp pilus assembly protein TadG n=1 Tax=Yoonia maricola TaxID=420999 RepID=A0A2M8WNG0_9RHOB|nr:TadE/TadG family type IV pilus assembly protein [Yoonia maricola]PJI92462.1 Flp pilus assembly protein TadG [Yoonia maricola]